MNMRKIIALLAAVLMLCAIVPFSAISVAAAPGDVVLDKNFDDGDAFFVRGYVENGYLVFDATTADWQNCYQTVNGIKANTMYKVTFKAMANKDANLNLKINNDWKGDTVKETVAVTTDWQDFELTINSGELTAAILMFASDYPASSAPIFYIDDLKIVETVDPALIGKVINGDFSDNSGWKLGNGATIANGMLTLTNIGAWSEAAMQTVPVKANTNYEISWKSQLVSGSGVTNMILMDASFANYKLTSGQNWMNSTSTDWINHTVTLNTGDHESIVFKLTSESGGTKTINIDDIKITEVKDPSFDGVLYNGDFETGKIIPWENLWGSNTVEMVAGMNSDYALKYTGGNWTQVYQSVTVEPNTNYIVTAWAKDAANSALWIKSAGGAADMSNKSFVAGSEWQLNTVTFNSGSNTSVWIGLMSLAAGGTATVDNVKVAKAVPASDDGYIKNGNFEAGSLESWQMIWDSQVAGSVVDDGHDSAFGAKVTGKAPWGQMRQKITVEANTDYKVTLWAKNVNSMALLIKDGGDSTNIVNAGINAGEEWTEITAEFNSGAYTSVFVGVMVNEATSYGTFDDIKVEKLAPAHVCEFTGTVTKAPTCTEDGVMTYTCTCGEGTYTEAIPAAHTYDDDCDGECNACTDFSGYRNAPHNLTNYTEAVIPANCQEEGHPAYYTCEDCGALCKNADGTGVLNPGWLYYTGPCVRPADALACEVVACTLCGETTYGEPCDRGTAPACTDTDCIVCGETIPGYGHSYEEGPLCGPGTCQYCGQDFDYIYEHENGSWAPCIEDGECGYGCGMTFPATGQHNYGEGIDSCAGGTCLDCGGTFETAHTYYYACDTHCTTCGEKTNKDAKHSVIAVAAKPAVDCVTFGNKAYWYCEYCNGVWLDANMFRPSNLKSVQIAGDCVSDSAICQEGTCVNCGLPYAPDTTCAFENTCAQYCKYGCGTPNPNYIAGHAYEEGVCSICGAIDPDYVAHVCQFTGTETKAPTCTEDGVKTYSCTCGEGTYTEAIPALGHTAGAAADCVNAQTCTVCGAELAAALGHTAGAAADCVNAQTCTVCGAELTAALGHTWADADCDTPKTCSVCGAIDGEALGHDWADADCDTPKTCSVCGATDGEALGHDWADADCDTPKTCSVCGATDGEALGHDWADADCDTPKTCSVCGATDGEALGHDWTDADCDTPKTCSACGATDGEALGHDWADADCDTPKTCSACGATDGEALGHDWADADCDTPKTCSVCGATDGEALGHQYFYPCDAHCMVCYELTNPNAAHTTTAVPAVAATCTANGNYAYWTCSDCGGAWLDENLTMVANRFNVIEPMTGHSYTNAHDATCNNCDAVRTLVLAAEEIILNGGNSVTEDTETGAGLAFKFETAVDGITFKHAYGYYADYSNATITIGTETYTLVEMGAIVNNKGANGLTLADVEADTEGRVLKIAAVKVFADVDNTINYAIRITNIPAENLETVITARSYYIYEKDGVQITVYGDDLADSYTAVKSK